MSEILRPADLRKIRTAYLSLVRGRSCQQTMIDLSLLIELLLTRDTLMIQTIHNLQMPEILSQDLLLAKREDHQGILRLSIPKTLKATLTSIAKAVLFLNTKLTLLAGPKRMLTTSLSSSGSRNNNLLPVTAKRLSTLKILKAKLSLITEASPPQSMSVIQRPADQRKTTKTGLSSNAGRRHLVPTRQIILLIQKAKSKKIKMDAQSNGLKKILKLEI